MLDAGTPKETIDKAAMDFGMPMGPIRIGPTRSGSTSACMSPRMLRGSIGRDMPEPPQWLKDKVAKGELGKKTGNGLYTWQNGHAVKAKGDAAAPPADMIDPPDPADARRLRHLPARRHRSPMKMSSTAR